MSVTTNPGMTPDEFLAWERRQSVRHAYVHGEVFPVSGGSPRHSRLAFRIGALLDAALVGGRCRGFSSDLRLALAGAHFVYADVVVVCGPLVLQPGTTDLVTNPAVVFEVLSKGTEAIDRGAKQEAYLATPSLQHYVLVSQRVPRVELYTREAGGGFHYHAYEAGKAVPLEHVATPLDVDELYAGVFELPGDEA